MKNPGYMLVPIEPTKRMTAEAFIRATEVAPDGWSLGSRESVELFTAIYKAMVHGAPDVPAVDSARVGQNPAPLEKALRESRVNDEREVVQLPTATFNELVAYVRALAGIPSQVLCPPNALRLLNEAAIHFESFPGGRDGNGMALLYRAIKELKNPNPSDSNAGAVCAEGDGQHGAVKSGGAGLSVDEPPKMARTSLDTPERICFYEQEFYVLSNFSAFNLYWKGWWFDTSEAAYHWEKFPDWGGIASQIRNASSAHEAFKVAEAHKAERRPDWDAVKVDIMRDILRAKVEQHEYVHRKLLETGERELVENSWRDPFWGWGPNRDGQNMLGKLWMEVRAELRAGVVSGVPCPK